eukprot:CAMPEP_0167762536 /NCGR_PEP_ID=MMETSP0110_2-20121227/12826_1 /TAXON_ID=629695 /ORGANISM="Gymnochlora sp., Strain CCMP2014" /LENGTH=515 /DNA_ID=CAMNT_0007649429 /DNA_START=24 /DNA_END=1571 /DNA_ORIENTATION=+
MAETCFYASFSSDGTSDFRYVCIDASSVVNATAVDISLASAGSVSDLTVATDVMWILITGILVFWMQAGFAMLEAGTVRPKNTNNILFKNLMDASFGAIGFWLLGYSFAFGNGRTVANDPGNDNGFIGAGNWALQNFNDDTSYHEFFFQWAFASAATTIVSGSVAERCRLEAYFLYSIVLTTFVYPVVVHWVWSYSGFLSAFYEDDDGQRYLSKNGVIDFAGSGVVHMVGGYAGLIGAIALGPRQGFFGQNAQAQLKGSNELLCSLGVGILWMGWYGFNAGSTLAAGSYQAINLASKVAVVTTIAAASSAIVVMFYSRIVKGHYDLTLCLNGVLAGLVSITAPCAVVEPWASMMIGIIGAFVFLFASKALKALKIDDPLDAFPVHGAGGTWGVLSVGIFATRSNISRAYGFDNDAMTSVNQFGNQMIGVICIIGWTCTTMSLLFFPLKFAGFLRISAREEKMGLDVVEHGVPWRHNHAAVERRAKGARKEEVEFTPTNKQRSEKKDMGAFVGTPV